MQNKTFPPEIKHEKVGGPQRPKGNKKAPKKITETYLHNAGLYYLQRYAASSGHFRSVMMRKVRKSCAHHEDQSLEDCAALVDALVQKFIKAGLLNDELYTRGMVHSLRRQGKSQRIIEAKLQAKNVPSDLIRNKIDEHAEEHESHDTEFAAALIFARRKRIGPYRKADKNGEETDVKKELSALARAGFNYDTSRRVLDIDLDEIESLN